MSTPKEYALNSRVELVAGVRPVVPIGTAGTVVRRDRDGRNVLINWDGDVLNWHRTNAGTIAEIRNGEDA
jgi:hypothetical protein